MKNRDTLLCSTYLVYFNKTWSLRCEIICVTQYIQEPQNFTADVEGHSIMKWITYWIARGMETDAEREQKLRAHLAEVRIVNGEWARAGTNYLEGLQDGIGCWLRVDRIMKLAKFYALSGNNHFYRKDIGTIAYETRWAKGDMQKLLAFP